MMRRSSHIPLPKAGPAGLKTSGLTSSGLTRRAACGLGLAGLAAPHVALAASAQEITWDDLVPPGVPFAEIIGEGDLDEMADTWRPIFDENAYKMNPALDGVQIRMPGYIIPLETSTKGVTHFILVPYVGACIHVPPPPANQLVLVTSDKPWPVDDLWDAVWVTGRMTIELQSLELGDTGYALQADDVELYVW